MRTDRIGGAVFDNKGLPNLHYNQGTQRAIANKLVKNPSSRDVSAFLSKAKAIQSVQSRQTKLMFALDATASREPTWASAKKLHRDLFNAGIEGTNLAIQLCYYRGLGEFQYSPWLTNPHELLAHMEEVVCLGGPTQLERMLRHYLGQRSGLAPVKALVFVGDAVEESYDALAALAGECGLYKLPLFIFQEGQDPEAKSAFTMLARRSGGAYASFDHNSADRLRELLGAVVRFTAGGIKALTQSGLESDKLLLGQLRLGKD